MPWERLIRKTCEVPCYLLVGGEEERVIGAYLPREIGDAGGPLFS
jgi:hypothetical protein